jgi:hypothetical protein
MDQRKTVQTDIHHGLALEIGLMAATWVSSSNK